MSDLLYVLVTLLSFGVLALLAGVLDRRLSEPDDDDHDPADDLAGDPAEELDQGRSAPTATAGGAR